ncbi:hypothetical protein [Caudoviricetes sp.]|nr:hypothetical protein [Caudoviricetes sp.]
MRAADAQLPTGTLVIRGQRTTDGTQWKIAQGRVVAIRERGEWTTF